MIKVLYVCNFESPYRIDFWNELTKYCDVTVLFTETKDQQVERNERWFKDKKYLFHAFMLKQTKLPAGKHICLDVISYVKDPAYDLIIFHPYSPVSCMYGIWYCIRHKIPYLINSDGGFAKDGKGLSERVKKYLISHAYAYTSTAKLTDDYLAFYGGNRERMFRYTLTTVREKDIERAPASDIEKETYRKKHSISETKVMITVGNMIPRKGFDLLLKAALNIDKSVGIYIIGGRPIDTYKLFCKENNLYNVHFLDFMDKDILKEYFRASDLFVLPTREDIWGLVVVEAMSCGLPVITTDKCIAGMELIEQGKNGYIYPVNDINQLAEYVNCFFNDREMLEEASREAIERILDVTIETMALRHFEIFKEVLKTLKETGK